MRLKNQDNREPSTRNEPNLIMVIRGGYILLKDPLNRKPITIKYLAMLAVKLIINCSIGSFVLLFLYSILMFEPDSAGRLGRDGRVARNILFAQEQFYRENRKFADNQNQLSLSKDILRNSDQAILKNISNQLSVVMSFTSGSSDGKWHIGTISVDKNPSRDRSEFKIYSCRFIQEGIVQIPNDSQLKQLAEDGKCPTGTENIDNRFGTMY
jgi:hypothetical protein